MHSLAQLSRPQIKFGSQPQALFLESFETSLIKGGNDTSLYWNLVRLE